MTSMYSTPHDPTQQHQTQRHQTQRHQMQRHPIHRQVLWLAVFATALAGAAATGPVLVGYAAAACATLAGAWHGASLVRLALRIHARRKTYGPCRGAGFLGLGVLFTAGAALGTGVAALTAGVDRAALVPAIGVFAAAPAYLLGLLLLPGAAPTLGARLRRAVDGLGVGICLLFAAWLAVVSTRQPVPAVMLGAAIVCCLTLSVAVVTGVRAVRHRPAALACTAGAALSTLGLAGLAAEVGATGSAAGLVASGLALVAGPLLIVEGARRAGDGPGPVHPAEASGTFAGYPLLAIPVGMAVAATAYQFVSGRPFDRVAVGLAIAGVTAIAVREALAALDVREYARRLAVQEAQFRLLVGGSSDVVLITDAHLVVTWQSAAAARQFGLSDQDVLGHQLQSLLHPDDAGPARAALAATLTGSTLPPDRKAPAEPAALAEPAGSAGSAGSIDIVIQARLRDGFGAWREVELTITDHREAPAVAGLVVRIRDVGERVLLRRSLDRLTWTDELTGLANRRKLLAAAAELRESSGGGALLVVRFERFAEITDLHGAAVGDAVLVEAARRLGTGIGAADLAARLSSDAFAVLTAASAVRAYALATRLLTMLAEPYEVPGRTVHLSADIGVADLSGGADADDVLRHAELARRRARQLGRGRAECYDASQEAMLVRRTAIEQQLPGVVRRGELDLVYQPVVELTFQQPVGTEALLRWRNPKLGYVAPGEFLPVAVELGLADEIGRWVLHQACRQLSCWRRDGRDLWMSVNVSVGELTSDGFLAAVATALDTHCVPADRIVVEVDLNDQSTDPVQRLAALRALGVRTAIDHFGTGPTALAHLRRLPVDILKIDRAVFSEPAGHSGPATPIVEVVVGLARRLGIEVIAAGLEAQSHADVVKAAGCQLGQGFLLAQPGHAEHVEAYLESHRARLL